MNTFPIHSLRFAKAYAVTMRPYLLFVSGIVGLTGMSLGTNSNLLQLLPLAAACFLSYGFGQALTDCTQIDTDSLSSPFRPLVQGTVRVQDVRLVSVIGLILCGIVFAWYHPLNILFSILAIAGLNTYTYFKKRWWAGPLYNSWIVFVLGYMCGVSTEASMQLMTSIIAMTACFFGYANFVVSGYFKDVEADRATGYNTIVVVYGRTVSAWVSLILCIATIIPIFVIVTGIIAKAVFVLGAVLGVISQILLFKNRCDDEAHLPITLGLHGYILLLTSVCISLKPSWLTPLVLFYLSFCVFLAIRPSNKQV